MAAPDKPVHALLLGNVVTRRPACKDPTSLSGRIILTVTGMRRWHRQAAGRTGSQRGRAGRGALPAPAPRAGGRPGVPVQRLLRRPGRGPGQVRDGAQGQGRRRPGHRGRRGVRLLPPGVLRRSRCAGILRAGRAGAGPARPANRTQAHRPDPRVGRGTASRRPRPAPGAAGRPDQEAFGVRVHPRSVERALARRRERHSKSR